MNMNRKINWNSVWYYLLISIGVCFAMYKLGVFQASIIVAIGAILGILIGLAIILIYR